MKHRNWFWGLFLLAAAAVILLSQTMSFAAIGFWTIAVTVLLAAVFLSSLISLSFFGIFVSAALLYHIYEIPLHWPTINVWILLLVAVLASIGCEIIFHPHHHSWESGWHGACMEDGNGGSENLEGDDISAQGSFSESCKYLHSDSLKKARLTSSFGKMNVYFDQVHLSPEGADVRVQESFGKMVLYLPADWRVVNRVRASFGNVTDLMSGRASAPDAPVITLTGEASFGDVEIRPV